MFSKAAIAVAIALVASATPCLAQSRDRGKAGDMSQDESSCRRDTRRLCRHVKADQGSGVFLSCLQQQRAALSKACKEVLESHGL